VPDEEVTHVARGAEQVPQPFQRVAGQDALADDVELAVAVRQPKAGADDGGGMGILEEVFLGDAIEEFPRV